MTREIGAQLRQRREQQTLTQAEMARASGIALRTLVRMEAGDPSVKIGTYSRAARVLGAKIAVLPAERHRPTLDELGALYPDDEQSAPAPGKARG
ncbi:MAG: helix-turn-helix transcriptional regulator [Burkholderiales bacterium]